MPRIKVYLDNDTHFDFTVDPCSPNGWIKWGDFARNFWFTARESKTSKLSVRNAVSRIKSAYKDRIKKIEIDY